MNFNEAAAVWLSRRFYRLIDKLNAGADRHVFEQEFDVVVTQTHAAVADAQADTKVGVGAVNGVQAADIQGVQAHRVIRTGRNNRWQRFASRAVFRMHFGGRGPGRTGFFTLNFGDPVDRRVFT
ncbi:Uncharacterised protein [Klebsiella oxytoca]|nr:Uncharacterised protein [Klebsiella oxytoca]